MKCAVLPLDLTLKREFIVAGGQASAKRNYLIIVDESGLGEAAGSVYYGATPAEIESDILRLAEYWGGKTSVDDWDIPDDMADSVCAPALCAASTARHDCIARRKGIPLYRQLGIDPPQPVKTSLTISLGDIEALRGALLSGCEHIKIKMDSADIEKSPMIRIINESQRAVFRIDANGSWDRAISEKIMARLSADRIELVEQPFVPDAVDSWHWWRDTMSVPVFMDESVQSSDDVERVAGYVDGVNIKIQKSGLLETAIEAMKTAHRLGLKVMLGCMVESSVGIAAAYHLSGLADYLDLDGRLLIESDPFTGLSYADGRIAVAGDKGHGVSFA